MRKNPAIGILSAVALLMLSRSAITQQPKQSGTIAIKAGRLVDVKAGLIRLNQTVIIEGDRIASVGDGTNIPAGVRVIDLSNSTLLPGLIDCHTHLLMTTQLAGLVRMNTAERALQGVAAGREFLDSGITTVRDLGNSGLNGDVALRNAIAAGWVTGPRIVAATRALSPIGGQFDSMRSNAAATVVNDEYVGVSGPDDARRAVGEAVFAGADLIKVIVDTGQKENHSAVLSEEVMRAIVEEAHRMRVKVAAHAISNAAIKAAAGAGVDSVEHAYLASDESLRLMHDKGIYLVPTDSERPPSYYVDRLQRAVKLQVKIAFGSDTHMVAGKNCGERSVESLVAYQQSGLSPLEILRAATTDAAYLLGWQDPPGSLQPLEVKFLVNEAYAWQDRLGVIEAGRYADLIAVPGDPLKDISELLHVGFVMKSGILIKNSLS